MGRWTFRHVVRERNTLEVSAHEVGVRLDRWLAKNVPTLGRKRAQQCCEAGYVSVNGHIANKSLTLTLGAVVCFSLPAPRVAVPNPSLALDVRFENEVCLVVFKPAGQATAPLEGDDDATLVSALLARHPLMQGVGANPLEPGLIHRLDTGTSGLIVAARTSQAHNVLKTALSKGKLEKDYLAIVTAKDLPDRGYIETPLRPSPHNARRVIVADAGARGARSAKTRYHVIQRREDCALILVQAERALRHQIRAHLASLGCPLVNDELYGAQRLPYLAPGRHALHARRVAWGGSEIVPRFDVIAPLPEDLMGLLRELGFRTSLSLQEGNAIFDGND